jgi:hypothetical protein
VTQRPPYLAAALVGLVVLAGYVASLAPSVTFWDAGELIASMKTLGIPHPPGTPLFVMMGHVWASLLPIGEYAWRTNLLSAVSSAAGAACWFLIAHEVLGRVVADGAGARALRLAGAVAAAVISAFGFTNWQNSNETEVYAVACFIVAATGWLALRWRATRGGPRSVRFLLLIGYLLGVSIANHLLALLAGPAILAFLAAELRYHPSESGEERRREWARLFVLAGLWALLLGVGLGSTTLSALGAVVFVGAAAFAATAGALPFALVILAIALVGVTPYLFLYLRAAQHPLINEADPSTWDALLAVIRRAQYPPRTPLDDPTVASGPGNPGRSLTLVGLQLLNYLQYFDWQWAKSLGARLGAIPLHVVPTVGFFYLGLRGAIAHRRADRSSWWLLAVLWLVTGLGLMAYMNFRPGFSIGYDRYPRGDDHEVRERDYFFVVSFIVWGVWAGLALTELAAKAAARLSAAARPLAFGTLALALVPPILNFADADRRHGADARLAGDFAYDLLNSVPPNGVLFTYGDNDTFPLWWAQEVAGIRQDVRVVCLALARTDWYARQLREYPNRPFDPARAPAIWRTTPAPPPPTWPMHTMTDQDFSAAVPQILPRAIDLSFGPHRARLDSGTVVYTEDFVSIRILQQNVGRRPIAWALTSGGRYYGLDPLVVQRGIAMSLDSVPPDTADARFDFSGMFRVALDVPATKRLMEETYRYADLMTKPHGELETTAAGIAQTLGVPFTQLAFAAEARQEFRDMVAYLERATKLSANPALTQALQQARARLGPDSGGALPKPR